MPTSKDFTDTRVLFNLFRNVMNYRNLRECRPQVCHVSVIYRHGRHIILGVNRSLSASTKDNGVELLKN